MNDNSPLPGSPTPAPLGSWSSASLSVGRNVNNPGAMYDWLLAPFAHLVSPGPGAAIGVASLVIERTKFGGDLDDSRARLKVEVEGEFAGLAARLDAVRPEQVHAAATKYLARSNCTIGWFEPEA